MFIPELKSLVRKMHVRGNGKSVVNQSRGQQEDRLKLSMKKDGSQTNMTAYLKRCTDGCNHENSINCDLHKSINKSTLSL